MQVNTFGGIIYFAVDGNYIDHSLFHQNMVLGKKKIECVAGKIIFLIRFKFAGIGLLTLFINQLFG